MSPEPLGVLIVGHGSPRAEANESLTRLAARVASRVDGAEVVPAFFSLARPSIQDQVERLAGRGARRLLVVPYFLYAGQHVTVDIPRQLAACRERWPSIEFEVLPTLQDEPALEDLLVDRVAAFVPRAEAQPADGKAIERLSHAIIDRRLGRIECDDAARAIIRRVVHATADFSFAETMRLHPEAVGRGTEAIRSGRPILCDVNMLKAGITKTGSEVLCAIGDVDVAERRAAGSTRAAAAMEKLSGRFEGAIVAVGNAPTALWKVLEIAGGGGPRPALVVGTPVGFVGAREAKQALLDSGLCWITNVGNRGGSPVAAAVVNALGLLAGEKEGSQ